MQLLISDANILIDMEEGQLSDLIFKLPFRFQTPDLLFYDELEEQHSHWLDYGLELGTLTPESVRYVSRVAAKYSQPSRYDCMALALAQQEQCPLITGDRGLRKAAAQEGLTVRGTIWLVEELVRHQIITKEVARQSYVAMEEGGSRLPWAEAYSRLNKTI